MQFTLQVSKSVPKPSMACVGLERCTKNKYDHDCSDVARYFFGFAEIWAEEMDG